MTKEQIAWTIAEWAFNEELARVRDSIDHFAQRLLNTDKAYVNRAARNYAPDLLHVIRRNKIERAIARRITRGE